MARVNRTKIYPLIILLTILQIIQGQNVSSIGSDPPKNANANVSHSSSDHGFVQKLLNEYGTDGSISVDQLGSLIKTIENNIKSSSKSSDHGASGDPEISTEFTKDGETETGPCPDHETGNDCPNQLQECLSPGAIFRHHDLSPNTTADSKSLETMSPTILYQLQNPNCHHEQHDTVRLPPTAAEVWGYGFLCVTLINLCALMGMVFLPLMRRSFYQKMLMFMVALAVGTLTGSGILFLIPESFEMTAPDSEFKDYYIWRSLTVVGGIYLFFLVERILKMIIKKKREPGEDKTMGDLPIASVPTHSVHCEETMNMSFKSLPTNLQTGKDYQLRPDSSSAHLMEEHKDSTAANGDTQVQVSNGLVSNHGHSHGKELGNIKSVAWMVILGDGLHNFIDGLSIGAAFTGSVMTGISVSLAVICEELPHELGDFAILLNSGMSMRQALTYNFLSACMCYLGLIFGIIIGEVSHGSVWIFAVAGGMFLYIALVDMLPEVNHAADEEEALTGATWSVFLIQNAGLLTGITIMVLLAYFSGQIDLDTIGL